MPSWGKVFSELLTTATSTQRGEDLGSPVVRLVRRVSLPGEDERGRVRIELLSGLTRGTAVQEDLRCVRQELLVMCQVPTRWTDDYAGSHTVVTVMEAVSCAMSRSKDR